MKTYVLRFRMVNKPIFDAIQRGTKRVETRAATKKYRDIEVGDRIKLICGKDSFVKDVKSARIFTSITGLLKKYKPEEIAPDVFTATELRAVYASFPRYLEKISENGLLAIELTDVG